MGQLVQEQSERDQFFYPIIFDSWKHPSDMATARFGTILQIQILFSCITSWGNFSAETAVEYILTKFVDAETISSSLKFGYSHKNWNVLLICLAALNLVLSPAMTESRMGRKTFLRNTFYGVKLSVERFVCLSLVNSGVIPQAPATC